MSKKIFHSLVYISKFEEQCTSCIHFCTCTFYEMILLIWLKTQQTKRMDLSDSYIACRFPNFPFNSYVHMIFELADHVFKSEEANQASTIRVQCLANIW